MKGSLPKTSKQYYLAVNHEALYRRAKELGYEGIILLKDNKLTKEKMEMLKQGQKCVGILIYIPKSDYDHNTVFEQLEETIIANYGYNLYCDNYWPHTTTLEDAVKRFPDLKAFESELIREGVILDTDYTDRCGHCHGYLHPGDRFCRICGTERGKGDFLPYKNISYGVYAPPSTVYFTCLQCGNHWEEEIYGYSRTHYCPVCGGKSKFIKEVYE